MVSYAYAFVFIIGYLNLVYVYIVYAYRVYETAQIVIDLSNGELHNYLSFCFSNDIKTNNLHTITNNNNYNNSNNDVHYNTKIIIN